MTVPILWRAPLQAKRAHHDGAFTGDPLVHSFLVFCQKIRVSVSQLASPHTKPGRYSQRCSNLLAFLLRSQPSEFSPLAVLNPSCGRLFPERLVELLFQSWVWEMRQWSPRPNPGHRNPSGLGCHSGHRWERCQIGKSPFFLKTHLEAQNESKWNMGVK